MEKEKINSNISIFIRTLTFLAISLSILITYYVKIIQKDYEIYTNPEGPETEDYFEEMGLTDPE